MSGKGADVMRQSWKNGGSRSRISGLAAVLMTLLFSIALPASTPAADRHALVIGNADYTGDTLSALKNPANDAALIADTLEKAGFKVTLVLDADLRDMKRAVRDFTETLGAAGPGALAAVYYSGHGFQAGGRNYLAPLGADLRDLAAQVQHPQPRLQQATAALGPFGCCRAHRGTQGKPQNNVKLPKIAQKPSSFGRK